PISLRRFPPLAKGGQGGVVPARPVTRSSHAFSLSVLSHSSLKARRIVFDFRGSRITPPDPPFARGGKGSQGGEKDRSLAASAQGPGWAVVYRVQHGKREMADGTSPGIVRL